MAMATGMPPLMSSKKRIFSMGCVSVDRSAVVHVGFGALQHAVAALPVHLHDPYGAQAHGGKTRQHHAVDDVHRQVDDGHLVAAQLFHHLAGEHGSGAKESDADHVDQRAHGARQLRRHVAVKKVHMDVVVFGYANRGTREDGGDQKVTRDLLGPGGRVVERVAGEELVEDRGAQQPEKTQGGPGFDGRARQIYFIVGGVELTVVAHDLAAGIEGRKIAHRESLKRKTSGRAGWPGLSRVYLAAWILS